LRARVSHTLSARSATHIFTVSEHSKRDILRFYGVPESKVEVIHNGVDTELFRPPEDPKAGVEVRRELFGEDVPFILYVGKLTRRRNLEGLTEAFARVRGHHGGRHRLLFVGFELAGSTVLEAARRCGVESSVHALPHVDHRRLASIYGAAELLAYPSSYEGFGLPVLEAMACGTPALALDATAFPEFAAGAAELLPDARTDTLEAGLDRLLGDADLRERLRREGPRRAARFDWRRVTARYVEALGALARRHADDG
jgi:glycosyltransferase involved in cell wall biosynthesis